MITTLFWALPVNLKAANFQPADQGWLDLSHWDFAQDGTVRLDGRWEFYWSELIDPETASVFSAASKPVFLPVPGAWNGSPFRDTIYPPDGYATYRLNIRLGEQVVGQTLALLIPHQRTAYRMWINGREAVSSGVVGTSRASSSPWYRTDIIPFPVEEPHIEIVAHIANFHHRDGGMVNSMRLGPLPQVRGILVKQVATDMFFAGAIAMVAIQQLVFYSWGRRHPSLLYLGSFCLLIVVHILLTGSRALQWFFPDLNWEASLKIEYLTAYLGLVVASGFMRSLYPEQVSHRLHLAAVLSGLSGGLATLVLSVRSSSELIYYFLVVFGLAACIYTWVILRNIQWQKKEAWLLGAGGFIFTGTFLHDLLRYSGLHSSSELIPLGLFCLTIFQMFILGRQFSLADYDSRTDYLIKKPNRRELVNQLDEEIRKARKNNRECSIILMDLDQFKKINDTYGHDTGDRVLQEVAEVVERVIRRNDRFGRWGGEEFLVLLPGADDIAAWSLAERIRESIERHPFERVGSLTASFGIASLESVDTLESLIKRADQALYGSKAAGGNKVSALQTDRASGIHP